ncbi:uncharacterized protein LOC143460293 [Clavelina lepadiformis]|uniref:Uncharacterized protein n=1 Tax=Clavelina lepadiformis TaxID=159417 RepID=A0ABP0GD12_CLALP
MMEVLSEVTKMDEPKVFQEASEKDVSFESDQQISPNACKHKYNHKKRRRTRRGHKGKYAPYSARNFLGRPKINAPANTTQFIFEDKDLGLNLLFLRANQDLSSNSDSEDSPTAGSSSCAFNLDKQSNNGQYEGDQCPNESDKFINREFDRMYDDVRAEMLRNESPESLSSRCVELESAIDNLQYLLQKETQRRQKIEEILFLRENNNELHIENEQLKQEKLSGKKTLILSEDDAILHGLAEETNFEKTLC